jgi:hypothetical protein
MAKVGPIDAAGYINSGAAPPEIAKIPLPCRNPEE